MSLKLLLSLLLSLAFCVFQSLSVSHAAGEPDVKLGSLLDKIGDLEWRNVDHSLDAQIKELKVEIEWRVSMADKATVQHLLDIMEEPGSESSADIPLVYEYLQEYAPERIVYELWTELSVDGGDFEIGKLRYLDKAIRHRMDRKHRSQTILPDLISADLVGGLSKVKALPIIDLLYRYTLKDEVTLELPSSLIETLFLYTRSESFEIATKASATIALAGNRDQVLRLSQAIFDEGYLFSIRRAISRYVSARLIRGSDGNLSEIVLKYVLGRLESDFRLPGNLRIDLLMGLSRVYAERSKLAVEADGLGRLKIVPQNEATTPFLVSFRKGMMKILQNRAHSEETRFTVLSILVSHAENLGEDNDELKSIQEYAESVLNEPTASSVLKNRIKKELQKLKDIKGRMKDLQKGLRREGAKKGFVPNGNVDDTST